MQPTHCLNCEAPLSEDQRFCQNCGQKTNTHRLTWSHFSHEVFHALVHADKGLVHLFKELVLRPGVVVREYLAGKRQKYFNPFSYFLIAAGMIVLASPFGRDAQETLPDPAILARLPTEVARANYVGLLHRSYEIAHFIAKHGNLLAMAAIPVFASVWWLFYRRRGYNYVEFLTGAMLIDSVTTVLVPLVHAAVQRVGSAAAVQNASKVELVLQIVYLTYGLTGFLQLKSFTARLGGATVVLLSQLVWMALTFSLFGAYLFRNRQFYQFPLRVFRALVTF